MKKSFSFLCVWIALAGSVSAAPITPTFDTFGDLPGATFGGAGIPTDPVAISTFSVGGDTITLGLAAHGRFLNPVLSHDGAGTYFSEAGANFGDPSFMTMPSGLLGATWDVDFYIDISGGGSFGDYTIELLYDFDPAALTDESDHGSLDFNTAIIFGGGDPSLVAFGEGSENLLFSFFADGGLPFITVPIPGTFDPHALGQYSLALVISDAGGVTELGRSAILLNVVPEPSSLVLLAMGGAGLMLFSRRRRKRCVSY